MIVDGEAKALIGELRAELRDLLHGRTQPSTVRENALTCEVLRRADEVYRTPVQTHFNLNYYTHLCYTAAVNSGWWHNLDGTPKDRNRGEMIALMHSELSEALEGERKGLMDDKLPHRRMVEVELADTLIRIFDFAGGLGLDLEGAVLEKLAYNANRADHRPENRAKEGGAKW